MNILNPKDTKILLNYYYDENLRPFMTSLN